MKAVILAAGKGTRFGEITKKTPKSLTPINGKPIIKYALESLPSSIKEIYIVIGHLGEKIKKYIGNNYQDKKIKYVELKELTGTATALWQAKKHLGNDKFLVLYGDDIYSKKELEKMMNAKSWLFGLTKMIPATQKYLAIQLDKKGNISGAKYPTDKEMKKGILMATGVFVLDSNIFKYKPVKIDNGEYGLPQTILKVIKKHPTKGVLMKNWIQINCPEDIKKAEKMLR